MCTFHGSFTLSILCAGLYVLQITIGVVLEEPHTDMAHEQQFEELLHEFERVGVDPNTISAGLGVPRAHVMRVLRSLPDSAGPAAFLTQLRLLTISGSGSSDAGAEDREDGSEDHH